MVRLNPVQQRIRKLAKEKDVIILAHNYQVPEVQDIADIVGDSLVLSMKATMTTQRNILFCGVDFMAESAKALNPERTVVHPVPSSRCPMAHMVDVETLRAVRKEHRGAAVVAYVNTTSEVKAEADICCTSANAVKVVSSLKERDIIFIPDRNLANYVQSQLPEKNIIPWAGYCHVHQSISTEQLLAMRREHPGARIIVHPECTEEVIAIADKVASTEGMITYTQQSDAKEFIIGTEEGLVHRLRKEVPGKVFHRLDSAVCPNMKKIRLDDVLRAIETMGPTVELPADIIERNKLPLQRMLAVK
jgi:quinolinate synthase